MTTKMLRHELAQRRSGQGMSRLAAWLPWAAKRLATWGHLSAMREEADSRRRDIAQVRRLAAQARPSQPGYADDLDAAAAALEARTPAHGGRPVTRRSSLMPKVCSPSQTA